MTSVGSIDDIRAQFPALAAGDQIRLDGPGGTQVPQRVVEAISAYLVGCNANARWRYPASRATDTVVAAARETFATFVGGQPDEIVFGPNMTTLAFHVGRALGRRWAPGDEVIVTELDHHANIAPWEALAIEHGIVLRWLPLDPESGQLRLELLPDLMNARTRLLAITGASNALGTIVDLHAAADCARQHGVLVFVDAVHLAPHRLIDVTAAPIDFLVTSPYKYYGPHAGVLWGRHDLLAELDAPRLRPQPQEPPERWQLGTPAFEAIAGAAEAVRWIASLGGAASDLRERLRGAFAMLHEREAVLFARLWDGLGQIQGVTRFGPPPGVDRSGTVSFSVAGRPAVEVATALGERGCSASHGHFYALTTAERCGVLPGGWVRFGLAAYTSIDDIDGALEALASSVAPSTVQPEPGSGRL